MVIASLLGLGAVSVDIGPLHDSLLYRPHDPCDLLKIRLRTHDRDLELPLVVATRSGETRLVCDIRRLLRLDAVEGDFIEHGRRIRLQVPPPDAKVPRVRLALDNSARFEPIERAGNGDGFDLQKLGQLILGEARAGD